jgi:peptidylprolyl isomerase
MLIRTATATLLAVAALGVGACGNDDDKSTVDNSVTPVQTTPETTTTATTTTTAAAAGDTIQKMAISKALDTKPEIPKPTGDPPTKLYSRDIVKGTGKKAKPGDSVTVNYVGSSYSNGEQFDASWDRNEPFQFQLGAQMVIAGWDQGVAGMRVGGRRLLVIPPDLGYGASGQGSIAPNETLMFVVDLKKVEA